MYRRMFSYKTVVDRFLVDSESLREEVATKKHCIVEETCSMEWA